VGSLRCVNELWLSPIVNLMMKCDSLFLEICELLFWNLLSPCRCFILKLKSVLFNQLHKSYTKSNVSHCLSSKSKPVVIKHVSEEICMRQVSLECLSSISSSFNSSSRTSWRLVARGLIRIYKQPEQRGRTWTQFFVRIGCRWIPLPSLHHVHPFL
jgi:hypothetical protein